MNKTFNHIALEFSVSLVSKDVYKVFNVPKVLVNKFYPINFKEQEKIDLLFQLQHFIIDVIHFDFKNLSTIFELCEV